MLRCQDVSKRVYDVQTDTRDTLISLLFLIIETD